jgi:hypothetical protein
MYGRKPPVNKPALKLADVLTAKVDYPPQIDHLTRFVGWQMLGNDQYGDCVPVSIANSIALTTTVLSSTPFYPNLTQVLAFYKSQNPGFPSQDDGMVIQDALSYLVTTGLGGKKALAFAKVDVTNHDEVKAALAIFGFGILGINVLAVNQDEFSQGQPWDYSATSPVDGGHAILGGGESTDQAREINFITWGAETAFTDAFWRNQVEEFWVVIYPEHLGTQQFLEGIDSAKLAADYKTLTGRDFPVPVPTPTPAPPPQPAPGPVDVADQTMALTARRYLNSPWHSPKVTQTLKHALQAWLKDKGL